MKGKELPVGQIWKSWSSTFFEKWLVTSSPTREFMHNIQCACASYKTLPKRGILNQKKKKCSVVEILRNGALTGEKPMRLMPTIKGTLKEERRRKNPQVSNSVNSCHLMLSIFFLVLFAILLLIFRSYILSMR